MHLTQNYTNHSIEWEFTNLYLVTIEPNPSFLITCYSHINTKKQKNNAKKDKKKEKKNNNKQIEKKGITTETRTRKRERERITTREDTANQQKKSGWGRERKY